MPQKTRRKFLKSLFKQRINWKILVFVTVIQLSIVFVSLYLVAFQIGISMLELLNLSVSTLFYGFFISLITGATGEEAAWRGYLFPIMVKKSGVIKGSILLGLIWAFWHAPLWFASSGFAGLNLVISHFILSLQFQFR